MKNGEAVVQQEVVFRQESRGNARCILSTILIVLLLAGCAVMTVLYLNSRAPEPQDNLVAAKQLQHDRDCTTASDESKDNSEEGTTGSETTQPTETIHEEEKGSECSTPSGKENSSGPCMTPECVKTAAAILSSLDPTTKPCDDIFQYACGSWVQDNVVPLGKTYVTPDILWKQKLEQILLSKLNENNVRQMNEKDTVFLKALDVYESCNNIELIKQRSAQQLLELIQSMGSSPLFQEDWDESSWNFDETFVKTRPIAPSWFDPTVSRSPFKPTENAIFLMPVDPLKKTEEEVKDILLKLGCRKDGLDKRLKKVFDILKKIKPSRPRTQTLTLGELEKITGSKMHYVKLLQDLIDPSISADLSVNVKDLGYHKAMADEFSKADSGTKADLMMVHLVLSLERYVALENQMENPPDCLSILGKAISLLSSRIVMNTGVFSEEEKQHAQELAENVREHALKMVDQVEWIDSATKYEAANKIKSLEIEMAYPDEMVDPKKLLELYQYKTNATDFFGNMLRIRSDTYFRAVNRFGKEATVEGVFTRKNPNTYPMSYAPQVDVMVNILGYPFGKLSPTHFGLHKLQAFNYGGTGVAVGHEIFHTIVHYGQYFDSKRAQRPWWTASTKKNYSQKTTCLIDQFSDFEYNGYKENGRQTANENVADAAGMKSSYMAYQAWRKEHGEEPRLPGLDLTNDQIFFIAYAQTWCEKRRTVPKGPSGFHAMGRFRLEGTLANFEPFAKAFNCPERSRMNRGSEACTIW